MTEEEKLTHKDVPSNRVSEAWEFGKGVCLLYGIHFRKENTFLNQQISVTEFYSKRFKKVLPFFAILVVLDIIISPSVESLYEAFADLTLLFGFLPDAGSIEVIGVAWFLGIVFVFYLIFPFFCYLLENKRRAWMSFGVSLIYNFVCAEYFGVGRKNILFCGCFFLAGGMIFLYREKITELSENRAYRYILGGIAVIAIGIYYFFGEGAMCCLLVSATFHLYALTARGGGLDNRVTHFFSGISMEVYLCHMVIFRVLEKLHINNALGNGWMQYIATVVLVVCGAIAFAVVMKKLLSCVEKAVDAKIR